MAKREIVQLVDDIHGGPATHTVPFALDRQHLVIDLDDTNAARLREALAPYIDAARFVGGRRPRRTAASTTSSGTAPTEAALIRDWAAARGIQLKPRGRIPNHIVDEYRNRKPATRGRKRKVR